jgi:excisionase family DNA binding protein
VKPTSTALPPLRARPPVVAPQLLDLAAAAVRLALAPRTVRALAARGRLPYVRLGRSLRFTEADLADLIARSRVGGTA